MGITWSSPELIIESLTDDELERFINIKQKHLDAIQTARAAPEIIEVAQQYLDDLKAELDRRREEQQ